MRKRIYSLVIECIYIDLGHGSGRKSEKCVPGIVEISSFDLKPTLTKKSLNTSLISFGSAMRGSLFLSSFIFAYLFYYR